MKVLFITNMYPIETHHYFGIHVKEQIDVLSETFKLDSEVIFINALEKGKLEYIRTIPKIIQKIKKNKYDVIHVHYGLAGLFLLFFRPKNTKIFITLHGGDIMTEYAKETQVKLSKLIIKRATKVFVLNDVMIDIVKRAGVPYELLPCGVDANFFVSTNEKKSDSKSKLILFPSDSKRKEKNYELFEKTIRAFEEKHPDFDIETACVHQLSRDEVVKLLNMADCLVMTSLGEGSPQIIKEALSCNLPVVSVPVGDVAEITRDVEGGLTSKEYNADELSDLLYLNLKQSGFKTRETFIAKGIYDNMNICNRLFGNYNSHV